MKKIVLGLTFGILMILCLTGCAKNITYKQISYTELQEKINNKESFIFVIGSSTCENCLMYKDVIEKTKTSKPVTMYYIYLDSLDDAEHAKVYSKYAVSSTPTTIFIENGAEKSTYERIIGRVGSSDLKNYLQKHGYGV